jgi:hypothetical protein
LKRRIRAGSVTGVKLERRKKKLTRPDCWGPLASERKRKKGGTGSEMSRWAAGSFSFLGRGFPPGSVSDFSYLFSFSFSGFLNCFIAFA